MLRQLSGPDITQVLPGIGLAIRQLDGILTGYANAHRELRRQLIGN